MKKIALLLLTLMIFTGCVKTSNHVLKVDNQEGNKEDYQGDNQQEDNSQDDNTQVENPEEKPEEKPEIKYQEVVYQEAQLKELKPNCGFYEPIVLKGTEKGMEEISDEYLIYNNLLHLRIDISSFSKAYNKKNDIELTDNFKNALRRELERMESKGAMAVIRFAYDPGFSGKIDMEPSMEMMKKHISQFSSVINDFQDAICAVECGLVGPWGEMHSSVIANDENRKKTFDALIKTYLDNVSNLPILVRRPLFIFEYLNIDISKDLPIIKDEINQRLGVYNDGYLGTEDDYGTYFDRDKETKWLSIQNQRLPYGGEVTVPESPLHDIDVCLPEMNLINLSYLNKAWNDEVTGKWKKQIYHGNDVYDNSTAYEYLQAHMGYLLVMKKLQYSLNDGTLSFKLNLENKGFGNIIKKQKAELVIVSNGKEQVVPVTMSDDLVIEGSALVELKGKCDIYVRLYTKKINDKPIYSIPFGNDCFDETYCANLILKDLYIE